MDQNEANRLQELLQKRDRLRTILIEKKMHALLLKRMLERAGSSEERTEEDITSLKAAQEQLLNAVENASTNNDVLKSAARRRIIREVMMSADDESTKQIQKLEEKKTSLYKEVGEQIENLSKLKGTLSTLERKESEFQGLCRDDSIPEINLKNRVNPTENPKVAKLTEHLSYCESSCRLMSSAMRLVATASHIDWSDDPELCDLMLTTPLDSLPTDVTNTSSMSKSSMSVSEI